MRRLRPRAGAEARVRAAWVFPANPRERQMLDADRKQTIALAATVTKELPPPKTSNSPWRQSNSTERDIGRRAAYARRQLMKATMNMKQHASEQFDGKDGTCAQCGEPWPCTDVRRMDIHAQLRALHTYKPPVPVQYDPDEEPTLDMSLDGVDLGGES